MQYTPALDGLRAVAVMIVVVSHYGLDFVPGGLGVEIFFVLSGYLITSLALDEADRNSSFSFQNFFWRRSIRIIPPMLAALAFMSVGSIFSGMATNGLSLSSLSSQLFFFHNYYLLFGDEDPIAGSSVLWSLAVEEHFYLLFPALFIFSLRGGYKFSRTVFVLAFILIIYRALVVSYSDLPAAYGYYASEYRAISIILGCYIAAVRFENRNAETTASSDSVAFLLLLALVALTYTVRYEVFRFQIRDLIHLPLFLLICQSKSGIKQVVVDKILSHPALCHIGRISYSVYLLHFFMLKLVSSNYSAWHATVQLSAALALTYLFALGVHFSIERPCKQLAKRYAT